MGNTALNDTEYSFRPLEVYVPLKDYTVDEVELEKSIRKSKETFARLEKIKKEKITQAF